MYNFKNIAFVSTYFFIQCFKNSNCANFKNKRNCNKTKFIEKVMPLSMTLALLMDMFLFYIITNCKLPLKTYIWTF